MILLLTTAFAQTRPPACIGAPDLPANTTLDAWIQGSTGLAVVDLPPGVYSLDATVDHLDGLVICGSATGVVLTGDHPGGALRGAIPHLAIWNVALSNSNGPALAVDLIPDGQGITLTRVTASVGGINPAVRIEGAGSVVVEDSLFTGGTSFRGTHLYLVGAGGALDATIERSTFLGGVSTGAGGAIFAAASTVLYIARSDFVGNRAQEGGAVAAQGLLEVVAGSFVDNVADCQGLCAGDAGDGGAILATGSQVRIDTNARFEGNRAESDGGALAVRADGVFLRDLTLCRNSAGADGGGLYLEGQQLVRMGALRVIENNAQRGGGLFGPVDVEASNLLGNEAEIEGSAVSSAPGLMGKPLISRSIIAYSRGAAFVDPDRVDQRSNALWRNAGAVDEAMNAFGQLRPTRDPAFRGYAPGVGECGSSYDYVSAVSAALVKTGSYDLEDPTWGSCPEEGDDDERICTPDTVLWGAYGLYADVEGGTASTHYVAAWLDRDGDGWPAIFDCADDDPERDPATEHARLGGVDTDCDGLVDLDFDGDGFLPPEDCDDQQYGVNPDAIDNDNNQDFDCDGLVEDVIAAYTPEPPFSRGCGAATREDDTDAPAALLNTMWMGLLLPLFWRRRND